jgi:uncharacterized protein (UPF0333 family)
MKFPIKNKGQALVEYALVMLLIVSVFFGIYVRFKEYFVEGNFSLPIFDSLNSEQKFRNFNIRR